MALEATAAIPHESPTILDSAVFWAKAAVFRKIRLVSDLTQPVRRLGHGTKAAYPVLLAEVRSPLWTDESAVESSLQFGKIQNLRKACQRLHLLEIPTGQLFSFWKQVGRATKSQGYAEGRELRQGCLIPTVGGGLCQLSNALYELALRSGFQIIERHAHSAVVPGSAAERGRDATVFWNYVDLRFRPPQKVLMTAELSRSELVVRFWGQQALVNVSEPQADTRPSVQVNSCTDCSVESCFRHVKAAHHSRPSKSAFLIEECWPEFDEFAARMKLDGDELFLPFHSGWAQPQRYQWDANGYARTVAPNALTLLAAMKTKIGPARQSPPIAGQVARSQRLADYYGERLSVATTHLYLAQTLLPFLWQRGDLGGRGFSVFMTRLPLHILHKKLDALAARFPERKTFQEFRAPDWMVDAEAEALEQAESIITPHALLAGLFPGKSQQLDWKLPTVTRRQRGSCIVFPGPALARKGAFELREALEGTNERLLVGGGVVERPGFWKGIDAAPVGNDWLRDAAVVVQPSFIENAPRPLLRALAAGIPVIATPECGIGEHPLLSTVDAGDVRGLKAALALVKQRSLHLCQMVR
jgi:VanW like protein